MSETEEDRSSRGLTLLPNTEDVFDSEALISPESFFEKSVLPLFARLAEIIAGRATPDNSLMLEVPDRLVPALRHILESKALKVPRFFPLIHRAVWAKGRFSVKLVPFYARHVLVPREAGVLGDDDFAHGESYYFNAADFEVENENPYDGKFHWQVREHIEKQYGVDSVEAQEIRKVIGLIKSLLYETALKENERESLADELSVLRMKIGVAAIAVIKDWLNNYVAGDGWVDATKGDITLGRKVGNIKNTPACLAAMERLIVGKYDLRTFG